jgi:hypothetical protein
MGSGSISTVGSALTHTVMGRFICGLRLSIAWSKGLSRVGRRNRLERRDRSDASSTCLVCYHRWVWFGHTLPRTWAPLARSLATEGWAERLSRGCHLTPAARYPRAAWSVPCRRNACGSTGRRNERPFAPQEPTPGQPSKLEILESVIQRVTQRQQDRQQRQRRGKPRLSAGA